MGGFWGVASTRLGPSICHPLDNLPFQACPFSACKERMGNERTHMDPILSSIFQQLHQVLLFKSILSKSMGKRKAAGGIGSYSLFWPRHFMGEPLYNKSVLSDPTRRWQRCWQHVDDATNLRLRCLRCLRYSTFYSTLHISLFYLWPKRYTSAYTSRVILWSALLIPANILLSHDGIHTSQPEPVESQSPLYWCT